MLLLTTLWGTIYTGQKRVWRRPEGTCTRFTEQKGCHVYNTTRNAG